MRPTGIQTLSFCSPTTSQVSSLPYCDFDNISVTCAALPQFFPAAFDQLLVQPVDTRPLRLDLLKVMPDLVPPLRLQGYTKHHPSEVIMSWLISYTFLRSVIEICSYNITYRRKTLGCCCFSSISKCVNTAWLNLIDGKINANNTKVNILALWWRSFVIWRQNWVLCVSFKQKPLSCLTTINIRGSKTEHELLTWHERTRNKKKAAGAFSRRQRSVTAIIWYLP